MQINIVPGQSGGAVTASLYNANTWALAEAIAAIEGQIAGVVRDLHGEGVLRGLQPIAGSNFVTVVPGVGFVNGIRMTLESAANLLAPAYSVARVWMYDYAEDPIIMTIPADEITWGDNAPNIAYSMESSERIADASAYGGYYTKITNGTATISYSGEGPLRLLYRRSSGGGTGTIETRTLQNDGSWGEWEAGTGASNINFSNETTIYDVEVVIAAPDPKGKTKEVRLSITGEGNIEAVRYLSPNNHTPSDNAIDLCRIYTGANGAIIELVDTRRSLVLSEYWSALIETKYKLLASTILCANFWGDGFGSLSNIGTESTAYIDTSLHQAVMASLPPYPVAQPGEAELLGQGTLTTQRISLTKTEVKLQYSRIKQGTATVKSIGGVIYEGGYVINYDNGTICWDNDVEPNPIAENETVDITYVGLSQIKLMAKVPGSEAVYGVVKRGTTAEHTGASATILDKLENSAFTVTPKRGISGSDGNAIEVITDNGDNIRQTMAFNQFLDRATPQAKCMELKSKFLGARGNMIRGSIAAPDSERLINTNFDANTNEWTLQDNSLGSWSRDTSQHRSGVASLKCHKTVAVGTMRAYHVFDAKPGLEYRASLYFRSDQCSLNIAGYVRIMSADRSVQIGSYQFLDSGSKNNSSWVKSQVDFTCPDTMNRIAIVIDVIDDTGSVWIDDCSVITLSDDAFKLIVEDGHLTPWYTPIALSDENIEVSSGETDKSNMLDADNTTFWQGGEDDSWLSYAFETQPTNISGISLFVAPGALQGEKAVAIDRQDAGGSWIEVASGSIEKGWLSLRLPGYVSAYALRIRTAAPIFQLRIYGAAEKITPEPMMPPLLDNLLKNASFEAWETRNGKNQPAYWTRRINGTEDDGDYSEVSNMVIEGLRSAADSADTANTGTYTSADITLIPGRAYMASILLKVVSIDGASIKAEFQPADGAGNPVGSPIPLVAENGDNSIATTCDWTILALKHTASTVRGRLILTRDGEANILWDNGVLAICGESFNRLTLDTRDPALSWDVPYTLATSAVNGGGGSDLIQIVNLTADPTYAHTGTDKNPAAISFVHLSGGGTEQTTVKITINRYALDESGELTDTILSTETFNNLTVAANDVPGGFTPSNRPLISTINANSSLINISFAGSEATATWANNPNNGAITLSGGITQHDTIDLTLMSLTRARTEAETLDAEGAINLQWGGWSLAQDENASGGGYIYGTGTGGDTAYIYIQGPVARLYLGYRKDPSYGVISLSLAEYDEEGALGSFDYNHQCLISNIINQADGADGWGKTSLVAQGLVDEYENGGAKIYCLRVICSSGTCNLDFVDADIVTYRENYLDLSVVPSIYSEAGKSALHHVLNSGYGNQGPSALVRASTKTYSHITDNPDLGSFWLTGTDSQVAFLDSPIFDSSPLAYWDQFTAFCDYSAPVGTSVSFVYTLNPLDANPIWVPFQIGERVITNAIAGQTLLRIRAILATTSAQATPIIYDWGLFWGQAAYAPAGARIITEEGILYLMPTDVDKVTASAEGFHPADALTVGSGVYQIPVTSTPTRILLDIEEVYEGPYDNNTGWAEIHTGLNGNIITIGDNAVEIYAVGQGRQYCTIYYRLPVDWQVKIKWTVEGYL